jgi:hypothetical protein
MPVAIRLTAEPPSAALSGNTTLCPCRALKFDTLLVNPSAINRRSARHYKVIEPILSARNIPELSR